MTSISRSLTRRFAVAAGAIVLGLFGPGLASTASAAGDGNINPDATGSIVIHKYESGSQGTNVGSADGNPAVTGAGVAGVVFTAFPITNLDLTTQADWNGLGGLTVPADACGADFNTPSLRLPSGTAATFGLGSPSPATNASGEATISNLPVKAYLVCETTAPETVKKKSAPFVVTIPFPNNLANNSEQDSFDNNWLYNVHVYPKNTVVLAPTKAASVSANGLGTDSQVSFPVTAKIPSIDFDDQFTHFVISDPLDAAYTEGKVASVEIDGVAVDPTHYTVTEGQTVSVGFTRAGLAALKTRANATVKVTFTATASTVPATGVINNIANIYIDTDRLGEPPANPPVTPPSDPPTPSNPVATSWGEVKIAKKDKDNDKPLSGVTFQVYNAVDPYAADCAQAVKTGAPISVNGATSFTSNDSGVVSIAGLFVDSKAGEAGQATQ